MRSTVVADPTGFPGRGELLRHVLYLVALVPLSAALLLGVAIALDWLFRWLGVPWPR